MNIHLQDYLELFVRSKQFIFKFLLYTVTKQNSENLFIYTFILLQL